VNHHPQRDSNPCLQDENLSKLIRKSFDSKTYEHPADFLVDFLVCLEQAYPDLAYAMRVWRDIPEPIRQGILAMVRTIDDNK